MGRRDDEHDEAVPGGWPPTPEAIREWLGGFAVASHSVSAAARPERVDPHEGQPRSTFGKAAISFLLLWAARLTGFAVVTALLCMMVAGHDRPLLVLQLAALTVLGTMLWGVLYDTRRTMLAGPEPPIVSHSQGRQPGAPVEVTVAATEHDVSVTMRGIEQRANWPDLVSVEEHGSASVLRLADGEALRVPNVDEFEPVLRAARHIASARAAHEEAVVARMEHGLSRPEGEVAAERGLSRLVAPASPPVASEERR